MITEFYYVYCSGILGVKTNVSDFRWVYGSVAPCVSREEYEKCIVKLNICVKGEKALLDTKKCDKSFQSYNWDSSTQTISCKRSLFLKINIGFNIRIEGNTIHAEVGYNYYKYVKNRVMNLHGIYYLLSDLANILLLKNGYLTLYASGVHFSTRNKGIVFFAPPNTGKTVTASELCLKYGCELIGEDIIIVKDNILHSCPWTSSYRKKKATLDSAGALGRVTTVMFDEICSDCEVTDLMVLAIGDERCVFDKDELRRCIPILNGYLFGYYSTPIIKILGYFDESYNCDWSDISKREIEKLIASCNCATFYSRNPLRFSQMTKELIDG